MRLLYLKNLDGLRFLAASLVVLDHCGMFKNSLNPELSNKFGFIFEGAGAMGVKMFFVLSGFLIFYLFHLEKEKTNTIHLKQFYFRRLLRIWPLYLAIGIFGTLLGPYILNYIGVYSPTEYISQNMLFMALFAVNIQLIFFTYNSGIVEILWTIGVEEHFYLIMPLLLKWSKKLFYPILLLFIFGLLSPFVLDFIFPNASPNKLHYYFTTNSFSLFGIGAIAGYMYYHRKSYSSFTNFLDVKFIQLIFIILTIAISLNYTVFSQYFQNHFLNPLSGIIYAIFILQLVSEKSIINFEFSFIKYLGKISYGIYLIHPFVAKILLFVFVKYFSNNLLNFDILYPLLTIAITAFFSYISYEFFEKQFLKLKLKHSAVKTRI